MADQDEREAGRVGELFALGDVENEPIPPYWHSGPLIALRER